MNCRCGEIERCRRDINILEQVSEKSISIFMQRNAVEGGLGIISTNTVKSLQSDNIFGICSAVKGTGRGLVEDCTCLTRKMARHKEDLRGALSALVQEDADWHLAEAWKEKQRIIEEKKNGGKTCWK